MALFEHPCIHNIDALSASTNVFKSNGLQVCLKLALRDESGSPAKIDIFMPGASVDYALRLAAAINAVPINVPAPTDRHPLVQVRPLEWNASTAKTEVGTYRIGRTGSKWRVERDQARLGGFYEISAGDAVDFETALEEAKAAAQADYTTRVLSALSPTEEPKPEGVRG